MPGTATGASTPLIRTSSGVPTRPVRDRAGTGRPGSASSPDSDRPAVCRRAGDNGSDRQTVEPGTGTGRDARTVSYPTISLDAFRNHIVVIFRIGRPPTG
ncbi:hypothetical protein GCM10027186_45330 [Micromonospora schwarzwaldensis]